MAKHTQQRRKNKKKKSYWCHDNIYLLISIKMNEYQKGNSIIGYQKSENKSELFSVAC